MADRLAEFIARALQAAGAVVANVANQEVQQIKDDLSVEIQYFHNPDHIIRSQQGEPPRSGIVTTPLKNSVRCEVSQTEAGVSASVGAGPVHNKTTGEEYAASLETGANRDGPRPYLRPSLDRAAAALREQLPEALRNVS